MIQLMIYTHYNIWSQIHTTHIHERQSDSFFISLYKEKKSKIIKRYNWKELNTLKFLFDVQFITINLKQNGGW